MNRYLTSVIHLDGPDKTGKDTVRHEIVKRSEGNVLVVNRSFLSQIVYAEIYNRPVDVDKFMLLAHEARKRGESLYYLRPSNLDEIEKRFIEHDEQDMKFSDYKRHIEVYDKYVALLRSKGCHYITIDTTKLNVDQSVNYILSSLIGMYSRHCKECLLHTIHENKSCVPEGRGKISPSMAYSVEYMFVGLSPKIVRKPYEVTSLQKNVGIVENDLLHRVVEDLNISATSYYTNTIKCSTKKNRITKCDIDHCAHILMSEVYWLKPRVIILIGKVAYNAFYTHSGLQPVDAEVINIEEPSGDYQDYFDHVKNELEDYIK